MPEIPNKPGRLQLLESFEGALGALPGVTIRESKPDARWAHAEFDLVVAADVRDLPVSLLVEARTHAHPRDVLQVAHRLAGLRDVSGPVPLIPILIAPSISTSSRELLEQLGVGYWDLGGSLYLDVPWAFYSVDRPPPKRGRSRPRNVFRGRATRVFHALLLEPHRQWGVNELAARASVAPSTVHEAFTFLEEQLWVERRGKGPSTVRLLHQPGALLDAWAEQHSLTVYDPRRYHRWAQRPGDLLRSIATTLNTGNVEYALTLASGAQLVAPFASAPDHLTVLVPDSAQLSSIAESAGLTPVEEGANVIFFISHERSPLMYSREIDDIRVASDVQLYLDLWAWPRRGREQARHLRTERLPY